MVQSPFFAFIDLLKEGGLYIYGERTMSMTSLSVLMTVRSPGPPTPTSSPRTSITCLCNQEAVGCVATHGHVTSVTHTHTHTHISRTSHPTHSAKMTASIDPSPCVCGPAAHPRSIVCLASTCACRYLCVRVCVISHGKNSAQTLNECEIDARKNAFAVDITEGEKHSHNSHHAAMQAEVQAEVQAAGSHTHTHTDRHTDTDRQTDRQT